MIIGGDAYRPYELTQHPHPHITHSHQVLLDFYHAPGDPAVKWPAENNHDEARESRGSKESTYNQEVRQLTFWKQRMGLLPIEKDARKTDLEWS